MHTAEHGGTHIDAPYHFAKDGKTVEHISMRELIAPCFVIDVRSQIQSERDKGVLNNYTITPQDIAAFEEEIGYIITAESIVLFHTGWGERWEKGPKEYLGFDEATEGPYDAATTPLHFPSLGADAARLLLERRVAGVGLDTASIDVGSSKDFIVHKILLKAGVFGIENINANIKHIPSHGSTLFCLPMKIGGGSGAPTRLVALFP
jgi:kynurenine formamidase